MRGASKRLGTVFTGIVMAVGISATPGAAQDLSRAVSVEAGGLGVTIRYPSDWSHDRYANFDKLFAATEAERAELDAAGQRELPQISIYTEQRKDHAEAVRRLKEIEAEYDAPVSYLEIGGWPALERRHLQPRPQPGPDGLAEGDVEMVLVITTAVAVDSLLVRMDAGLAPDADAAAEDEVRAILRSLTAATIGDPAQVQQEIEGLETGAVSAPSLSLQSLMLPDAGIAAAGAVEAAAGATGASVRVTNAGGRDSELEIAASADGRDIVIGSNNLYDFSNDAGQTWNQSNLGSGGVGRTNGNDPSVGWGPSGGANGTFVVANIGRAAAAGPSDSTEVQVSVDQGANFTFQAFAYTCTPAGDPACGATFPDQEHIAVDRLNVTAQGNQVYSAWRHLDAAPRNWGIVCSQDSGATWSTNGLFTPGDFPRISVGQDGFVYVVYRAGQNVMLRKFNSCENNQNPMVAVGPAVTVASSINDVACPTPGLDRCNFRNTLSSPMVAVDDTNPNHVFVAYAVNTNPGGAGVMPNCANQNTCNENIIVQDSEDGGTTWLPGDATRTVTVSSGVIARRFMPWVCAVGGKAYVTWYDRRAASPGGVAVSNNSLTDVFTASAFLNPIGDLTAGSEFQVNDPGTADAQCEAGFATGTPGSWPAAVCQQADSESCSLGLQLGGRCGTVGTCRFFANACNPGICPGAACTCMVNEPCDATSCDFSDCNAPGVSPGPPCTCPAGDTCSASRGSPKYGDYNGNTCVAGRVYMTWASGTAPASIPASTNIDSFFASKIVCCVPQIQAPSSVDVGDACPGDSGVATLDVCNTGEENLEIASITSDDPDFSVDTPSSGFPVVISSDFCFPFQVEFQPLSPSGDDSAVLTISSNDPVNPTVTVDATASGLEPRLVTAIADAGDFGDVCRDDISDLDLTISNSGGCELTVSSISASPAEFEGPGVMTPPLVIGAFGSARVPIRFAPTTLGMKSGSVTVVSDDPDTPVKQLPVSGDVPPGEIRLTGSGDFGDVCAESPEDRTISVCNVGACNLNVSDASLDNADFTLVNSPFPAAVSPDSCLDVVVAFTPTSAGEKMCTLTVTSDDPLNMDAMLDLSANTPFGSIDVPPDQGFRPTVIQSVDVCETPQPFPVSNTGRCDLDITDFSIPSNPEEFSISGLPSFPIILGPGHIAGSGDLRTVFAPDNIDRDRAGTVSVTYVHDPITDATMTVERDLCGEGVRTGARVLVTQNGVPLPSVKSIRLHRINANRNKNRLDSVDNARNLPLQIVTPAVPCAPFAYHREYGTVSNPVQLLPGSYEVTVQTRIDGKMTKRTVGFDVDSCGFNPTIIVNF